jgi:cell division septation protein DedD
MPTTRRVVNELRRKGLSANSSPIPIDDKRKIYRVYVGRYNSWDLAREVTKQVRKLSLGKYAIPA